MSSDIPPAPPESAVIRLAREAMGMTAESAAQATRAHDGKGVSTAYWRDVERGYGGRRGERVRTRASDRALAAMARAVGVTPAQLTGAGREDAARVLEEILRREYAAAQPGPQSVEDDEALTPFIKSVRADLAAAMRQFGPNHTPAQAFSRPWEAVVWGSVRAVPDADERVKIIAETRLADARFHEEQGRNALLRIASTVKAAPRMRRAATRASR